MSRLTRKPKWWLLGGAMALLLLCVVALGVRIVRFSAAVAAIEHHGGRVFYNHPEWLQPILPDRPLPFCDRFFGVTLSGCDVDDDDLDRLVSHLARLRDLTILNLSDTCISDAGLQEIGRFTMLDILDLSGTQITDKGLPHLSGLANLTELSLDDTGVTNAGITSLGGLIRLTDLSVSNTDVTDEGIARLQSLLPALSVLDD